MTRNGDVLSYPDVSNFNHVTGTGYIEAALMHMSGGNNRLLTTATGDYVINNNQITLASPAKCVSLDGTNVSAVIAASGASSDVNKYACAWGGTMSSAVKGLVGSSAFMARWAALV